MRKATTVCRAALGGAMLVCSGGVLAAAAPAEDAAPLTEKGEALLVQYTDMLETSRTAVTGSLPTVGGGAYMAAHAAEGTAKRKMDGLQKALKKNRDRGLLNHRKDWLARTDIAIAQAREALKAAEAMADPQAKAEAMAAAQKKLQEVIAHRPIPVAELKKCEEAAAKAKQEEPALVANLEAATRAHLGAQANTLKALNALNLSAFLQSEALDTHLARYFVLNQATPRALAEYAQQGDAREMLIKQMLADSKLLTQIAVAGGPSKGNYGRAMEIHNDIHNASAKAETGVLQRLALAVSLEHAEPHRQINAAAAKERYTTVDPVKRYLHYEKAYLAGELDPAFKDLTVWDYRMVVDGDEPEEILTWGNQMLRNYRPDHIATPDYRWRYVKTVATDIRFGSEDNKFDKPELQNNQNVLLNGGVCGRRAFFGRFILRAFGIPTVPRPQKGHAALAHWAPEGWVVCLGSGWGTGWVGGFRRPGGDLAFLAETQGRQLGDDYAQVWRAKQIAAILGKHGTFWSAVAQDHQRGLRENKGAVTLAAVGTDIGEANESKVKEAVKAVTISDEDRKIVVSDDGVITIPAAACSKPTGNTDKIKFMPSNLGGMQLHYERMGDAETFEYAFNAPKAGTYALTARVVTPSWKQHLQVTANGGKAVDIALPFTVGMWDTTQPVNIDLAAGKNVLTFSRDHERLKGLTIRDFTLAPVK